VNGKPQFVHRTFAEYFTAHWFSRNFDKNRSVLEHILFDSTYGLMTDMFNRMLAKDSPLHRAVLQFDDETIKTLLEEDCDLDTVDKGGRTVLHLIVIRKYINMYHPYYTFNRKKQHKKDSVLQWTPLQYPIKLKKWLYVEQFLKSNVDRSGLDMISQRKHDTDYINSIIMFAAWWGFFSIPQFLSSIGVNIHQASSGIPHSTLHAAIDRRNVEVVEWLIDHGADCNTRYSDGQTPLFYAVTKGRIEVVQALVEKGGASLDIRDDKGRTALDWAEEYMSSRVWRMFEKGVYQEIVRYLRERCNVPSII
jgi:ankyrin repeat protein